jgi:limonene-1,2-epoxide hydrolase
MSTDEAKRELDRKHARAVLQSNDEILACFFRIDKINKDGIVVKSDRLDLKKNMNW